MDTRITSQSGVTIVEVQGKLDTTNAHTFQAQMLKAIDDGSAKVLIDCTNLGYVSSAGLRSILAAGKKTKALGGKVLLCNPNAMVREVLEITGLAPMFPSFSSREEAIAAF